MHWRMENGFDEFMQCTNRGMGLEDGNMRGPSIVAHICTIFWPADKLLWRTIEFHPQAVFDMSNANLSLEITSSVRGGSRYFTTRIYKCGRLKVGKHPWENSQSTYSSLVFSTNLSAIRSGPWYIVIPVV